MDDVADVRRAEVHAEVRREAVLELAEVVVLSLVLELLLAGGEEPHAALELLPQLRDERLELEHPALVLVDVLAHLVDHDEERLPLATLLEHRLDGLDDLAHARARAGARAGAAVDPARRLRVALRLHDVEHVREVVVGLLFLLGDPPVLAERLLGGREELVPLAVALQAQLEVGDQVALRAVAEARLHLAAARRSGCARCRARRRRCRRRRRSGSTRSRARSRPSTSSARGASRRGARSAVERGVPSGSTTPSSASPRSLAKLDLPEP